MPRIKVTLADGSTKHVNMTRDQLVYYNATGKLDKDIVNQDFLMLPVLIKLVSWIILQSILLKMLVVI